MPQGTIKFFDVDRGYGFAVLDADGSQVPWPHPTLLHPNVISTKSAVPNPSPLTDAPLHCYHWQYLGVDFADAVSVPHTCLYICLCWCQVFFHKKALQEAGLPDVIGKGMRVRLKLEAGKVTLQTFPPPYQLASIIYLFFLHCSFLHFVWQGLFGAVVSVVLCRMSRCSSTRRLKSKYLLRSWLWRTSKQNEFENCACISHNEILLLHVGFLCASFN
jgi:cold shock CspA family protein